MSANQIIARTQEKAILEQALKSNASEFIAVYGRRRVGKTHLIREFFGETICFELVGKYGASLKEQLDNFAYALSKETKLGIQLPRPVSWVEAFRQLEQLLESPVVKNKLGKHVVFFDELPWINTPRSKSPPQAGHFNERPSPSKSNTIFQVCSS